ncbi:uncharacterized protein SPPG_04954 [Spizellomyces punctatus DAOM BR117]|uniref:Uncharacterized protein n=1 Tax=Spizellomyces punctatus (strain DAOM BR117) TaxID=645134 RepID=A0A0L0HDP3_SPIPD|nr:uncharacterized protein SPPG_04954 [Spizellomyces punctatus DAOM BR117]KNC99565.1 hypothetical protein SPPG_04954 [Spizellomyces punctatus DAOM BR117]|eukprot:XP_016607605.1 hypothetical protein SPPG_04954 [Spizellomyces punctatus DAOM BR117]
MQESSRHKSYSQQQHSSPSSSSASSRYPPRSSSRTTPPPHSSSSSGRPHPPDHYKYHTPPPPPPSYTSHRYDKSLSERRYSDNHNRYREYSRYNPYSADRSRDSPGYYRHHHQDDYRSHEREWDSRYLRDSSYSRRSPPPQQRPPTSSSGASSSRYPDSHGYTPVRSESRRASQHTHPQTSPVHQQSQQRRVPRLEDLPEPLRVAWSETTDKEAERWAEAAKRLGFEEDKIRAQERRIKFELWMADWEVEKWEHQLDIINKQLEEHDKSLARLQHITE